MKCPHCEKRISDGYFENAHKNAEAYGSRSFVYSCPKCHKKISFWVEVITRISDVAPASTQTELSFGI